MRKFRHKSDPSNSTEQKQLRAACYVRVSTEEQAQHGYSVEAQKEKLCQACNLHNYKPSGQYVDDGYSGKDLKRPEVQRLIADARAKKFDVILVYKLDRFSRRLSDLIPLGEKLEDWASPSAPSRNHSTRAIHRENFSSICSGNSRSSNAN